MSADDGADYYGREEFAGVVAGPGWCLVYRPLQDAYQGAGGAGVLVSRDRDGPGARCQSGRAATVVGGSGHPGRDDAAIKRFTMAARVARISICPSRCRANESGKCRLDDVNKR